MEWLIRRMPSALPLETMEWKEARRMARWLKFVDYACFRVSLARRWSCTGCHLSELSDLGAETNSKKEKKKLNKKSSASKGAGQ